jgi:pimeloyl-ACP methyl ester carboxylesterase
MDDFCYRLPPDRDDFAGGRLADMDPEEFEVCVEETFRRTGTFRCPVLGMPAAMLRHIEHESLIITGDDETHPRAAAEALGRLLPNARISKIPPTIGPKLKPEEIEEAVAFLRG